MFHVDAKVHKIYVGELVLNFKSCLTKKVTISPNYSSILYLRKTSSVK